jgi:nucleotide-binding universal stress UspA family protein
MYAKIMVAVDGSSIATRALDEALRMAPAQGSTLILVHVIEYPHIYVRDLGYDPAPITEALLSDGRRVLEDAAARVKSRHIEYRSVMVDKRTSTDSIAERLQRVADEQQVELVVLGTHGRGGFKRLLLGSVAEAFLRSSSRPVLLVPGGQHDDGVQS